jgi:LacI family transcriptional regulator
MKKGTPAGARKRSVRRKGHAVTIHEVALRAGVSPMTVSRVVNRAGNVREATRKRVMQAVKELGYTPNLAASTLAAAQGARLALIYTNPSAAYLRELLVGALHGAARNAVQLVVDSWEGRDIEAERVAVQALARSVAGVILPPPLCESKTLINELVRAGVPVVAIASERFAGQISTVHIDDFRASRELTAYLIGMGHTRIGYIKGDPNQADSARRYEGFVSALKEAGIAQRRYLVQQGYFTYRSGLVAAEKLLALQHRPTAIIAANDDMAAAVISAAHRQGLMVPRDLSVVGFDDSSAATMVWPELTTVRQPTAAMADQAIDLLLRGIRNRAGKERVLVDHVVAHVLVRRDSAAAPLPPSVFVPPAA